MGSARRKTVESCRSGAGEVRQHLAGHKPPSMVVWHRQAAGETDDGKASSQSNLAQMRTESGVQSCSEFAQTQCLMYTMQSTAAVMPTWRNGRRDRLRIYYRSGVEVRVLSSAPRSGRFRGPWPSGKASPLQGEDRRFESDRVHLSHAAMGCSQYAGVVQW